ncbi:hypothetical protein DLM_1616 [Aquitalea magnusonii]|uniref:Uncharacterized protein n=1 Tax=Aquitalea magnusonii TaxID=332411 RepID=A0A3G9GCR9_9NEIS|nr:hypothetical protein [Aquitalea magnusonii]BBF85235.1 hypothetical protein DLM_1616 [Aquitalea magnusonii]
MSREAGAIHNDPAAKDPLHEGGLDELMASSHGEIEKEAAQYAAQDKTGMI